MKYREKIKSFKLSDHENYELPSIVDPSFSHELLPLIMIEKFKI